MRSGKFLFISDIDNRFIHFILSTFVKNYKRTLTKSIFSIVILRASSNDSNNKNYDFHRQAYDKNLLNSFNRLNDDYCSNYL